MTATIEAQYSEADRVKQIGEVDRLWQLACTADHLDPGDAFVVLSDDNPYAAEYRAADAKLTEIAHAVFTAAK